MATGGQGIGFPVEENRQRRLAAYRGLAVFPGKIHFLSKNMEIFHSVALLQVALDVGMEMPQVSGNSAIKNIDLGQVMELIKQGVVGDLVEIESGDGDTVHIFVE